MYLNRNVFPTIIIPLGQIFITTAAATIFFQTIRDKINPSSSRYRFDPTFFLTMGRVQ